jgi:hypothetical protein
MSFLLRRAAAVVAAPSVRVPSRFFSAASGALRDLNATFLWPFLDEKKKKKKKANIFLLFYFFISSHSRCARSLCRFRQGQDVGCHARLRLHSSGRCRV